MKKDDNPEYPEHLDINDFFAFFLVVLPTDIGLFCILFYSINFFVL